MIFDENQIDALVARPGETLNVEIKQWFDPKAPEGKQKIVRAAFALYNRNGGYLLVGFKDKTLQPDTEGALENVRVTYHQDAIQQLISHYASDPFEVQVAFAERDQHTYPVIVIAQGVRVPVAVKRDLDHPDSGKRLLKVGDVYFRTLNASGSPSSSVARPEDWRDILDICFDNREADIGRFLRRHLAGTGASQFLTALQGGAAAPEDLLRNRCAEMLKRGSSAFERAATERGLSEQEAPLAERLTWEIALIIDPPKTAVLPDKEFLATFAASNPRYTAWPIWLDARLMTDERSRPVVRTGGWEALIVAVNTEIAHRFEFFRLEPTGQFYLRRILQDDAVPQRVPPGERLDPVLMVYRMTEAVAVGIAIAQGLKWPDSATLGFMFRWRNLKGRRLDSWSNPAIYVPGGGPAQQDEVSTFISFPLWNRSSTIPDLVKAATEELFVAFDGTSLPRETYEEQARRVLERRLN
ncbi:putative DNA binding domain-containing protein [Bradyrhizobium manausense]|uniref:AlbA family DNA-binding domain-containing protein n=1 Tax=Bradyrhizobium manausense TaxID=989370 RepID=UPI001BAC5692|nr:RNA-binding domain-containing protein [Bradyrhizobium manausense]MBR0687827.1 putative DNA binding domain-containing protein [Bradyrhizobium manausense]